ncbi:MAG: putative sugar nucleotidyl transferase, partial [Candidatus Anammoxibacter sp.]
MNQLCIFEDGNYKSLLPLVYNKPVYDLHCGMFSLLERITNYYPNVDVGLFCREYLADVVRERRDKEVNSLNPGKGCLFINGRLLMQSHIPLEGDEEVGVNGDTVVYARIKNESCKNISPSSFLENDIRTVLGNKIKFVKTEAVLVNYFWDTINNNNDLIEKDFREYVDAGTIEGKLYDGVHIVNRNNVFIGCGSKIKPGSVLDAEDGSI